jgi:quinol monooxygenase YgiN
MQAVEDALKEVAAAVHEEDGCEVYALHRGQDRLVFVEKWRDDDAFRAHVAGPNVKTLNEKLAGRVAETRDVQVLEALPVGDSGQGEV